MSANGYHPRHFNPQAGGRRYDYFAMRYRLAKKQAERVEHAHLEREEAHPRPTRRSARTMRNALKIISSPFAGG
jgi:hypothetical protein